jgi:MscS family membrane protein
MGRTNYGGMNWEWLDFHKHIVFGGNNAGTVATWLCVSLGILIAAKILLVVLRRLSKRFHEASRPMSSLAVDAVLGVVPMAALSLCCVVGGAMLDFKLPAAVYVYKVVAILVIVTIGIALYRLVEVPVLWFTGRVEHGSGGANGFQQMISPLVRKTLRVTILLFGAVQIGQVLTNTPVTAILAGLGVGGLAVALAAQETIKNFFGSLVLATDRPFDLGDRIQVDAFDGNVEAVGMRSTRIRTLDGHLVTIPNGELANKSIRNVAKRPYIQRNFTLGLVYDTPPEKIRRALAILKELLEGHEGMRPDHPPRVTFTTLNQWSLDIQVIYWYAPADWWAYMAFSEDLNLKILERFSAEGIEFAFPTQTQNTPKDQQALDVHLVKEKSTAE